MIGKRFIGVLMAIMMMMVVTVLCVEESKLSTLDIYSPTGEFGKIDLSDKSSVQNVAVVANSTQNAIGLFNYQYVSVNSLVGLGWLYYYVDLAPYSTVSITHSTSSGSNNFEIYMDHISKPTIYYYSKKGFLRTYSNVLTSDSKTYSNRLYIAVRNANAYTSNGGFTMSVSINYGSVPKPTPTTPTYVYRSNNSLTLALGIPSLIIALTLLFVVIAQTKNIRVLTNRVNELERKLNASMQPSEEMMSLPVMMNVPLMSSNSLQQDHEETQSVTVQQQQQQQPMVQPPTSYMPQQQPITTPQLFHQFVQQQTLPPQFRNAQPYPLTYPQVVFAQPNVVQEQQQVAQQQTGQTQTKQ